MKENVSSPAFVKKLLVKFQQESVGSRLLATLPENDGGKLGSGMLGGSHPAPRDEQLLDRLMTCFLGVETKQVAGIKVERLHGKNDLQK